MSNTQSSSDPSWNESADNVSAASNLSTSSKKSHSHRIVGTILSRTKNRFRKSAGSHDLGGGGDVDIGALDRRLSGNSFLVGLEVNVSGSSEGGDKIELQADEVGGNGFLARVEDGDVVESVLVCDDDSGAQELGKSETGSKERVGKSRGDRRASVEMASTSELSQSRQTATLAPLTSLDRISSEPPPQSPRAYSKTALKRNASAPVQPLKSSMTVRTIDESLRGRARSLNDRVPKSVAFSSLEIREYPRAVGDNPSVISGPPLAIDWWPEEREPRDDDSQSFSSMVRMTPKSSVLQLDSYESHRPTRRSQDELMVPPQVRTMWLMEWGHCRRELNNAAEQVAKERARREKTNQGLKFYKVHEAGESMGRVFKRMVGRKGNNRALYEEWKKRANEANAINGVNKVDRRYRSSLPPSFPRVHDTAVEKGKETKRSGSLPQVLVNVGDAAIGMSTIAGIKSEVTTSGAEVD